MNKKVRLSEQFQYKQRLTMNNRKERGSFLPSRSTISVSLSMVIVVIRTNIEKTNVQIGSAILYSGWK